MRKRTQAREIALSLLYQIDISGEIPPDIIEFLIKKYGKKVKLTENDGDKLIDVTKTHWYEYTKSKISSGDAMRNYREIFKMTQAQLGEKLGGISRQHVSDMENGRRAISIATAKKLSKIFKRPVERFLEI